MTTSKKVAAGWEELLQKGREYKATLFENGTIFHEEDFGKYFPSDPEEIERLWKDGYLLRLPHPFKKDTFGYPIWQAEVGVYSNAFKLFMEMLDTKDPWARWYFFNSKSGYLGGHAPYEFFITGPRIPKWLKDLSLSYKLSPLELLATKIIGDRER